MELDLLSLFVAVAETSSFSAAAKKLALPKSSVSRGIAKLEAQVGAQLLHRSTRHVALSTAGAALYERTAPLLASLQQAVGSLPEQQEQPSGELRLTAPNDLGATILPELLTRFTARYPSVRVDVRLTNRNVDLVAEGFDVALRAVSSPMKDSSLVVRKLSPIEMHLFASPNYLARRGMPRSVDDLGDHDWVLFRGFRNQNRLKVSDSNARIVGDDFFFIREAVRQGAGIGLMPAFLGTDEVATGQLVRVLPRYSEGAGHLMLVYPSGRNVPRKVTAFREVLTEALAARPIVPHVT
jgi:DNA-binding transcriptional LysR family regulator